MLQFCVSKRFDPTTQSKVGVGKENVQRALTVSSTTVVAQNSVTADLSGEAVIVNLNNGVYYGLSGVGYRIWELIRTPSTLQAISDKLVEEYNVEPTRLESDLLRLIEEMEREGLVAIS